MATSSKAASPGSGVRLVIVESPSKAKTISGFLGDGYIVESSVGHIRDLPRGAADVPAKYKGEPWARLGVNTENGFEPLYVISPEKRAQVAKLKSLLAGADELYLATDEDREGEAIAWHLLETLKPKVPVKRMVFHEITPAAIRAAADNPREIDDNLVDAQETRRILDRLYGYEVSPVLWKKVMPKLSAGRVQSVATRIIVQRERERMAFRTGTYWGLDASMAPIGPDSQAFKSSLATVEGRRLAAGRDFDPATGAIKAGTDVLLLDEDGARSLAASLQGGTATVSSVEEKPYTRRPYPPFMTSTMQQEAGRKLGFNSERTMRTAQRLYENGFITYMRTDSTTLSTTAQEAARSQARELYGPEYVPDAPRQYTRKVKNAQEAHEAIRPAGENFRTPGQVANKLSGDEFRLYELIWQRTIASQMVDARGLTLSLRITASTNETVGRSCVFSASGRTITFPGFLRAYVETVDAEAGGEADDAERRLPNLAVGQQLDIRELIPAGHVTTPPARYTEPSLIGALQDLGIGRPSTYTSIIRTIIDRGYVWKKGQALVPSWIAFAVIGLLEQHFARLVDYDFTAAMEDELDGIADGRIGRTDWLTAFYFGGDLGPDGSVGRTGGLKKLVGDRLEDIDAREVNSLPLLTDSEGRQVLVRVGRYGPYLERTVTNDDGEDGDGVSVQRANLPEDLPPDEVTAQVAEELFAQSGDVAENELGVDPGSGNVIVARDGRYGPYVTEVIPAPEEVNGTGKKAPKAVKPRTASLFKTMTLDTIDLTTALRLLSLPRVVGVDPADGGEITAQNGRYGPYLKKGTDSRSLTSEDALFTVSMEEALALYAQPKTRGRSAAAAPPLREVGTDPVGGKPMVIKDGRFGPYVTDGETNASLRKGDEIESLTVERAAELLADRRARGPAPKRTPAKKAPAKKAPAKKPPATTARTKAAGSARGA